MAFGFLSFFSNDVGIDLGTANTLIFLKNKGIVVNEPSIVAFEENSGKVLAVGSEAREMLGRTHKEIMTIRPLKDGVIADFEATEVMIREFIKKANVNRISIGKIVVCVPSGITEVEKRAVRDSAERAGAREVYLVAEAMASAVGIGLDIEKPVGNMIVDIGGGTTEIAVISLGGIVLHTSIRIGGDEMNESIFQYFKKNYNLLIGEKTAELLKCEIGSVMPLEEEITTDVKGRDLIDGIPKTVEVNSAEIREALMDPVGTIVESIKLTLERTPPELSSDILDHGIILTGGGALLRKLDQLIQQETQLTVNVADSPLTSVVNGTGKILSDFSRFYKLLLKSRRI
ncbi:rod shape-determining protein [candidate division KSB1 bacterium 4484_188]|nr:MAG: rod shape-determining protein [candidate division KSB1 bacterium 4484_188]HFE63928.1 rod shape-determining protein [Caldithrix sp.]